MFWSISLNCVQGAGESVQEGIDNAALNVLWKMWDIPDGKLLFPYDLDVSSVLNNSQSNVAEAEWTRDKVKKQAPISRWVNQFTKYCNAKFKQSNTI